MMHGSDYGQLTKFDEANCHQWYNIGYPRAGLILEAQALLYNFLRRFLPLLLDNVNVEDGCLKWDQRVGGGRQAANLERYAADMFATSPAFAPHLLFAIVDARKREAEDELWLLQTEPALLQQQLRQELSAQVVKMYTGDQRWAALFAHFVMPIVGRIDYLQCLAGLCESVADMHEQYETALGVGQDISIAYEETLIALEEAAFEFAAALVERLGVRLSTSPAFQQYFTHRKDDKGVMYSSLKPDRPSVTPGVVITSSTVDYFKEEPLLWPFLRLRECFALRWKGQRLDATTLLDFFDDLVAASKVHGKKRIDSHVYALVSDIAVINQIFTALRTHRPRFWTNVMPEATKKQYCESQQAYRVLRSKDCRVEDLDFSPYGERFRNFYDVHFPSGPKNEQWLEQASRVRELLQTFWDSIASIRYSDMSQAGASDEEIEEAMVLFRATQAPEHLEELQEERLAVERRRERRKQMADVSEDTLGPHDLTTPKQDAGLAQQLKPKIKTKRDQEARVDPGDEEVENGDIEESASLHIAVKANNLPLFDHMYPSQQDAPDKTKTKWEHFASALTDAGFTMSQSRGSAVAFSKPEGSIVFHRPHPNPVIDSVMLRAMGKRLRKWFGWGRDVFVQRAKDE